MNQPQSAAPVPDLVPLATVHPTWLGSAIPNHVAQLHDGIRSKIQPLSVAPFLVLGLNRLYSGVDGLSESLFVDVARDSQEASVLMADRAMKAFSTTALGFPGCSDTHPWKVTHAHSDMNMFSTRDTGSIACVHRHTQRLEAFPAYEVLELQLEVLRVQSTDCRVPLWHALFDYCPRDNEWRHFLSNWSTFPCEPTPWVTTRREPSARRSGLFRWLKRI